MENRWHNLTNNIGGGGVKLTTRIRNSDASNLHAINTGFSFFSVFTPAQESF